MFGTCKLCGKTGDASLFYAASKHRCRECVHRLNRDRYYAKYREVRLAVFAEKDRQRKSVILPLSEVEKSYAAGLLDGEGCIRIIQRGKYGGRVFRVGQYTLVAEMSNTNKDLIDWMHKRFGGYVSYGKPNPDLNRREQWHWSVAANNALACLDAIYPYAVGKRRQVILGRRFQRYAQRTGRKQNPRIASLHQKFYARFKQLNARGLKAVA